MEDQKQGKILVALDGSESALQVVRYLGGISGFRNRKVVLFSVFEGVPDYYWDISRSLSFHSSPATSSAWETGQKNIIEHEMEKARKILVDEGFHEKDVDIKLRKKHKGAAQDIIEEAMEGYSLVAAGRKGKNRIEELIFGSVTARLIDKLTFSSLLMVGKNEVPGKALIPLDCLEGTGRIVGFAAENLKEASVKEITLLHVIKGGAHLSDAGGEEGYFLKEVKERVTAYLEELREGLAGAGFSPENLKIEVISDAASRAGAIIEYAREKGFGTLVLGRKSESDTTTFSMGEVSSKVVHMSKGLAVFIVK